MAMKNTTASVKGTNKLINIFIFDAGVRQGDEHSTTLFTVALHHEVLKIYLFTKLSQICALH
jgi:hypothetical protein